MKTEPTTLISASHQDDPTDNPGANSQLDIQIILLDDNLVFADAFKFRFMRKKICHFPDPQEFIAQSCHYSRDTIICIDNDFGIAAPLNGIQVAQRLHELGFTRLFLVSGTYFSEDVLPDYLTFIEKINLEYFSFL